MMKNLHKLPLLATLFFGLFFTSKVQASPIVIYVDSAAIGANDGSSWADAFSSFQAGIDAATAGNELWVAKGTYQPTSGNYFSMKSGVKIFGGFTNTATLFSDRNWVTNPVILLGNDNAVLFCNGVDADAQLDGVTVTGGTGFQGAGLFNLFSSAVFSNIVFSGNSADGGQGGGVYNNSSSSVFTNIVFLGNSAPNGGQGGAMFNSNSPIVVTNTVFSGNSAGQAGAVFNSNSASAFTNVTFFGNSASNLSGGIYTNGSAAMITNCIFWGNTIVSGSTPDIFIGGSAPAPSISYSYTQTSIAGTANLTGFIDPFVNNMNPAGTDGIFMTADDGLQLRGCGDAVNSGNDAANVTTTDIAGQPRFYNASTIDMGAYENQGVAVTPSLALNADTLMQIIAPGFNYMLAPNSCRIIGELVSNGASPVSGNVTSRVWIDNSVQSYNGQPYAQRHYDITPETGAATATATIVLFFTQAEFDAYNVASSIDLPAADEDAAGIAALRILQFHGTSVTGTPGTYSGTTETIDPADEDILWIPGFNVWQVSFGVTGFSGFAVTTDAAITLPLHLLSFTGQLANGKTLLQWKTDNEVNTKHFEVEESSDGVNFSLLATVTANGAGNNSYSTIDAQTKTGNNYYRLKSVDNDGRFTYSNIVLIKVNSNGKAAFFMYPNPAAHQLTVQYDNANSRAQISIYNLQGQKVVTTVVTGSTQTTIDVSHLTVGTYMIEYRSDTEVWRDKFIKVD